MWMFATDFDTEVYLLIVWWAWDKVTVPEATYFGDWLSYWRRSLSGVCQALDVKKYCYWLKTTYSFLWFEWEFSATVMLRKPLKGWTGVKMGWSIKRSSNWKKRHEKCGWFLRNVLCIVWCHRMEGSTYCNFKNDFIVDFSFVLGAFWILSLWR